MVGMQGCRVEQKSVRERNVPVELCNFVSLVRAVDGNVALQDGNELLWIREHDVSTQECSDDAEQTTSAI